MGDTYDTGEEAEADRAQQKALLAALGAWDRALRRDDCGAWTITGNHGTIHTWGDGKTWVLFVRCRSALHWTYTKRRLSFCAVVLDCEDEGTLRLHQPPTAEQAAVIRDILGIRKRMDFSPEDLERRRASMTRLASAQGSANATSPLPQPTQERTPKFDETLAK